VIPLANSGGDPDLSWLGPTVTGIAAILVAIVGAVGLVWRRRQDRKAEVENQQVARQASESDEWSEVRLARAEATKYYNLYTFFRNLFYDVQAALRHLVRKLRDAHPDMDLDKDVVEALALKPEADDAK